MSGKGAGILRRLVHSIRGGSAAAAPRPGRLVVARKEDTWRAYPADGLTPSRMAQILRSADAGDIEPALQLYEQMEEKDAHLFSVAQTRRLGLTGLAWEVISAAEIHRGVDRVAAEEAASHCRRVLTELACFEDALRHLSLAIGRNVSVVEMVWDVVGGRHEVVDLAAVDFGRITVDAYDRIRILTREAPYEGILPPVNKFIVNLPHSVSGHPMRGGLLRVSALAYLGKQFAMKDWLVFAEIFGMPIRIARYDASASPEEKREMLAMLRDLGTAAFGIFSKAVELEIKEASQGAMGGPPYERVCNFLNRELSKAWLGQTLTTDTAGETGTHAAAVIHDRVRVDIQEDDIRNEARMIRRDLLGPMTRVALGESAPVPYFRRVLDDGLDPAKLAGIIATAVNELGARVPAGWAHDALGIPQAGEDETCLTGRRR
ncbi:MAG: DUF935 family protein [Phycisphaerae bacterium]|nr:DUF935 family protein [Phycisphaerae bacterium]